jgi:uncharacterized membrane protein YcjF (UPF0283 family)
MFKRAWRFLQQVEWNLSLWQLLFGGGGLLTTFGFGAWAASASAWLDAWGPIGWVAAGLASMFVVAITSACLFIGHGIWRYNNTIALLNQKRSEQDTRINILDDMFIKKIITVDE